MKREILFRGLRTDGKGWVEGCLYQAKSERFWINTKKEDNHNIWVEVIPETVGQFLLTNKFGQKVFENDRVRDKQGEGVVLLKNWELWIGSGAVGNYHAEDKVSVEELMQCEIIGNIYEP